MDLVARSTSSKLVDLVVGSTFSTCKAIACPRGNDKLDKQLACWAGGQDSIPAVSFILIGFFYFTDV